MKQLFLLAAIVVCFLITSVVKAADIKIPDSAAADSAATDSAAIDSANRETPYYEIINKQGQSSYILGTVHINSIDLNLLTQVKSQITGARVTLVESAQFGSTLPAEDQTVVTNDSVLRLMDHDDHLSLEAVARIRSLLSVSDDNILDDRLRLKVLDGNVSRGFLFTLLSKLQDRIAYLIMKNVSLTQDLHLGSEIVGDSLNKQPLIFDAQIERTARDHQIPIVALDRELYPLIDHYNKTLSAPVISDWIMTVFKDLDMVSQAQTNDLLNLSDSLTQKVFKKTYDERNASFLGDLYQTKESVAQIHSVTDHPLSNYSSFENEINDSITTRHNAWLSRVQKEIEIGNAFIAVGLDHVVSSGNYPSLVDLLQEKGFKVIPHQILKSKNLCDSVFASAI
jgi:uncharacterized protein YbaP (TraB family)